MASNISFCFFDYRIPFRNKEKRKAINLLVIIFFSHLLSIPLILYTIEQLSHPYYWEFMERTGLIYTHLSTANVIYSGIWIIFILMLLAYSYFWIKEFRGSENYKNLFVFSALSGCAMLIVSGSNIITGKEFETSQHVERFIVVWLVIALIGYISYLIKNRINFNRLTLKER